MRKANWEPARLGPGGPAATSPRPGPMAILRPHARCSSLTVTFQVIIPGSNLDWDP